ncbi:protein FAM228B-like isoform X3 [Lithobates pipiens]
MTSPRSEMMSTCRGMLKEGVITMQTSHLPKDLLPAPEHAKAVTFRKSSPNEDGSFLPKKVFPSRPGTRSLSTTSLRKTEDWLAYKPYVQLIMDAENEKISAKTQCVLDAENHYNQGSAFMRDYDSSEYDPFINRLCKHYLRVSTPVFKDPLLQQYQKRYEEEKVALHCDTGRLYSANEVNELNLQKLPQAPLGRQTMNGIKWLKTPFGYIESDIRVKSRQRVRGSVNQGTLDFKTWADTKYPPEIFNTERNICHKRKFSVNTSSMPAYSKQWGPDHTVTMIKI